MPVLWLGSCADLALREASGFWVSLCSYSPSSSFLYQGCHAGACLGWSNSMWGGEWEGRKEAGRGQRVLQLLLVLIVASFPSNTEVEQDGGVVSMSEQTLPKKWGLASSWDQLVQLLLDQVCILSKGQAAWGQSCFWLVNQERIGIQD